MIFLTSAFILLRYRSPCCVCGETGRHAPVSEQKPHGVDTCGVFLPVNKQAPVCNSCLLTHILCQSSGSRGRVTSVSTPASVLQQAWGVFGDCRHLTYRQRPKWTHLPQKLTYEANASCILQLSTCSTSVIVCVRV